MFIYLHDCIYVELASNLQQVLASTEFFSIGLELSTACNRPVERDDVKLATTIYTYPAQLHQ